MKIEWSFTGDKAIYSQIVEQVKLLIASGRLKSGQRLDSVRDIASAAKVNPNTVQRAFAELERMGLVYTERTNGRFITCDEELIGKMKKELAAEQVSSFLKRMKALGYSKEMIADLINSKEEE